MQRTPQELHKQYLRARNRLAIAAWLMVALGWVLSEHLVHGRTGLLPLIGGFVGVSGLIGAIVVLIAGKIVLWRRYRS